MFLYECVIWGYMYNILLAVDETQDSPELMSNAVTNLPGASSEIEVHVLNVFAKFSVQGEAGSADSESVYDPEDLPKTVINVRDQLQKSGVTASIMSRHGEPGEEILNASKEHGIDLLIIGGRKRTPVGKALFGSVAQRVLLEAECPVMQVRGE